MRNLQANTIGEIEAGDLVYFDDTLLRPNYDEYWEVISKNQESKEVELHLNYLFEDHYRTVHISQIKQRLPSRNKPKV